MKLKTEQPTLFQTMYSVTELAMLAGVSRYRMGRFLAANGLRPYLSGKGRRVVLLAQIKKVMPELWESIEERAFLRKTVER
jgi:hypothetical protein